MGQSKPDLKKLLIELEYLSLAITQAAASQLSKCLEFLHANNVNILDKDFYDWRRKPEAQDSVIRTWRISFDQIRKQKSRAAEILSFMSVLNRQSLQKSLFYEDNEQEVDLIIVFGTLQAFSPIIVDKERIAFEIHRLVQIATQKWLELQGALDRWQEKALHVLFENFSLGTYENWMICQSLISHAQVVLKYKFENKTSRLQYTKLLHNVGCFDHTQGRYKPAEEMSR